jgi:hypothetical protein
MIGAATDIINRHFDHISEHFGCMEKTLYERFDALDRRFNRMDITLSLKYIFYYQILLSLLMLYSELHNFPREQHPISPWKRQ